MLVDRSVSPNLTYPVNGVTFRNGWRRSTVTAPHTWVADNPLTPLTGPLTTGTYCVEGNAIIAGVQGTSTNPLRVSIIATHSVSIAGTPFLAAASSDSILVAALGDVQTAGNSSAGAGFYSYDGMIYANAQCNLSGNVTFHASIVCRNQAAPAGATDYIAQTTIAGSATITHTCNGWLNGTPYIKAWYQPTN
jgi:hypothetical protein